jgi:hypothetical protein
MAVNETLDTYSIGASVNTPAGSDNVGTDLDDHLRDIKKNVSYAARWVQTATVSAAATIPVTSLHKVYPVDPNTTGASVTITLPTVASAKDGWATGIRNTTGSKLVIIDGNGAETIDGAADLTLSATNQMVMLGTDGVSFFSLGESNLPQNFLSNVFSDYTTLSASATAVGATDLLMVGDKSSSSSATMVMQEVQYVVGAGNSTLGHNGGWVVDTAATAFGATATEVEITVDSGYDYRFEWYDVDPNVDGTLLIQMFEGAAYVTTGYTANRVTVDSGNSVSGTGEASGTGFMGTGIEGNTAYTTGEASYGMMEILQPDNANIATRCIGHYYYYTSASNERRYTTFAGSRDSAAAATKFQFSLGGTAHFDGKGYYVVYKKLNGN